MNDLSLEGGRVRRSFDRAAASYDQAAALQRHVADQLLPLIRSATPATIVDAGCGTGYCSAALATSYPQASRIALDLAPSMLQATRQRVAGLPLLCADMQALPLASRSVDLLFSSLMLQWCNQLDTAFVDARRCLKPSGEFVFSTFGPNTLHELRSSFNDGHTHVSHFPAAQELCAQLEAAGFKEVQCDQQTEVLAYPDAKTLMRELKAIGAHNATAGRARGLTGKRGWQSMLDRYETLRTPAGLPATYELIYIRACSR